MKLGDICTITKGETGIMKAIPGNYCMIGLGEEDKTHNSYQFDAHAVIVPLISSTGHGSAAMKRVKYYEGKFALGTILCAVIPKDENIVLAKYLHLYLHENRNEVLVPLMKGAANVTLPIKRLYDIEVPIPSIQKQQNIIFLEKEILAQVQKLSYEISLQKEYLAKLKQSILKDAISGKLTEKWRAENGDVEPANELLKRIKAEKKQMIKEGKIRKEKPLEPITESELPFPIPPTWQWCRLGDLCYIASGSTPSAEKFCTEGIPYLKMYNMRNQKIDFEFKPQYISNETHNTTLKRSRTMIGDVLMNIVGPPLGKLALVPDTLPEANFNQAMILIRSSNVNVNQWIYWFLNEKGEIYSIVTKGVAGQDNISTTQTKNLRVAFPPIEEQKRIVEIIKESLEKCSLIEEQIKASEQNVADLLKAVLAEAFQR